MRLIRAESGPTGGASENDRSPVDTRHFVASADYTSLPEGGIN
jgi:hypothetical protein